MTLRELLADIHALEEDLLGFERKYGLRSETFYPAYSNSHYVIASVFQRSNLLAKPGIASTEEHRLAHCPESLTGMTYSILRIAAQAMSLVITHK